MQHATLSVHITLQVDLLDMLYRKSLRLGVDVRNARGIGTVVNLQSNDARKVWMMPVHIHTLWNSPFQVGSCSRSHKCMDVSLSVCPLQLCMLCQVSQSHASHWIGRSAGLADKFATLWRPQ